MTTLRLDQQILKALRARPDIWLDNAVLEFEGAPSIRGIQLRRVIETETRGKDSYHPFQYTGWMYYGQAFAIETDIRKGERPLTKEQLRWRDLFVTSGGLYITATNMHHVTDELGKTEPQPWSEYARREVKVK